MWRGTRAPVPAIDPLSVSAPPGAYFITGGASGRTLYTRDGSFSFSAGRLLDGSGQPVLGYTTSGGALEPLTADPVDVALGFTGSMRIGTDGSVSYDRTTIDPRTGLREMQTVHLGVLALARFPAASKPQAVDALHVAAPSGVAPHVGWAGDGNFEPLAAFSREQSGIDLDLGLQRLQEAYLAFDAIRAAGKAQGGIEKTTMDLLK